MKKRFLLTLIFIIFSLSIISTMLVLNFVDPYTNRMVGVFSLIISSVLSLTTFLAIFLYFFKKIYYRWDVYIYHVYTSFRQSFFVSLFLLFSVVFYFFWTLNILNIIFLLIFLIFIELFIKNIEEKV